MSTIQAECVVEKKSVEPNSQKGERRSICSPVRPEKKVSYKSQLVYKVTQNFKIVINL